MVRRGGPLLLLAALGLLFFADLVRHPTQTLYSPYSDLLTLHLPSRIFLARSWQETGDLPRWCPYNFAGLPFVHDIQVSAFYPPHWPLLVVSEQFQGAALSWLVVLHVIAAGWCMFFYARHQGLETPGALVAALGYMFAGKLLLHVLAGGHYNMVPLAWLPLVLLFLERALRRRSLRDASWAGVAFALIVLAAYPYVILYAGLFVALWTFGTALEEAGHLTVDGAPARRRTLSVLAWWLGLGAWTVLVAVALGAVQLWPGLEFSASASRAAGVPISAQSVMDGLRSLIGLVGPPLTDEPNCWENRAGLGILWLTLALVAPLSGERRTRFQAGACLVLVIFALGGAVAVQWLPGFRLFRLPSRMFLVAALPLALLAGRTVQMLLSSDEANLAFRSRARQLLVKLTVAVIVLAGVFGVVLRTQRPDVSVQFHPYWLTLLVTVPAAFWLLARSGANSGRRIAGYAAAWVVVLLVDLTSLTWPLVDVRSDAEIFAPSACVRYLAEQRGEHGRVLDINPITYPTAANHTPLWPGLPMVAQVEPVRGFNPIDIVRFKEFLQFITDDDQPLRPLDQMFTGPILGTFAMKNQSLADLLGVRYLLQPADLPLAASVPTGMAEKSWSAVMDDPRPVTFNFISVAAGGSDCGLQPLPPYRVYENRDVLPRAFIVAESAPLPERAQILATLKHTDFRRRVLLEGYAGRRVDPPSDSAGSATVQEYLPNRVTLAVDTPAAGFLVLTDIWFPGWTCTVDGAPTPIYRANYLFRAVELPAGTREVVFRFTPMSYLWGHRISGLTLLAVMAFCLWPRLSQTGAIPHRPQPERERHAVSC